MGLFQHPLLCQFSEDDVGGKEKEKMEWEAEREERKKIKGDRGKNK